MERRVTVRVDLVAGGNLGASMDAQRAKANELNRVVGQRAPVGSQQWAMEQAQRQMQNEKNARLIEQARSRIDPDYLMSRAGTERSRGSLRETKEAFAPFHRLMGIAGAAGAALGLVAAVADRAGKVLDLFHGHVLSASDALERATFAREAGMRTLQGDRLGRHDYERLLSEEFRARLEAVPESQRQAMVRAEIRRLQGEVQNPQANSLLGAQAQAALERVRYLPHTPTSVIENIPGGGMITGMVERFAPRGLAVPTNTNIREAALRAQMTGAGIGTEEQERRLTRLRREGVSLAGERLSDADIRTIASVVSGTNQTTGAIGGIAMLQQMQERARRGWPTVPGLYPTREEVLPQVQGGEMRSGEFYDRLVGYLTQPEEADKQQRIIELLGSIDTAMQKVLNLAATGMRP